MIHIDENTKGQLLNNCVGREIVIHFPDDNIPDITDESIVYESMVLDRSIISGNELKFGGGISSQFKIKVIGINADLKGKNIEVSLKCTVRPLLYPSEDLFPSDDLFPCGDTQILEYRLFTGKIDSALRQKNRAIKEIIAFDAFYSDSKYVYDFMERFATYSENAQLYTLRDSLEDRLGYDTECELFNDQTALSMTIENTRKAIKVNETTTTDVLKAYAELNAAFAVMDRFNNLSYIQLLSDEVERIPYYFDLEWEEYETADINSMKVAYGSESEKCFSFGYNAEKPSVYTSSDNLIAKCCTDVSGLVHAFYDNSGNNYLFGSLYKYRPFKAVLFDYWWLEPGDRVDIETDAEDTPVVSSFVFNVSISGIRNIKTTINADGKQYLGKEEMSDVV